MEKNIYRILKVWRKDLEVKNHFVKWHSDKEYNLINECISSDVPTRLKRALRDCRDYSLSDHFDIVRMLGYINKVLEILDKRDNVTHSKFNIDRAMKDEISYTQKYVDVTRRLYRERIRFLNDRELRNIDISLENPKTARKIRRIVEKRMAQAYCSIYDNKREDNGDRHLLHRAYSYQLHNLGMRDINSLGPRTSNTHWKISFDKITQTIVYKSKLRYESFEDAKIACKEYHQKHPYERMIVSAYKCAYCGKYHIGHYENVKNSTLN